MTMKKISNQKTSKYIFLALSLFIVILGIYLYHIAKSNTISAPQTSDSNVFFENDFKVSDISLQTIKNKLGEPSSEVEEYIESENISTLELEYPSAKVTFYKDTENSSEYIFYNLNFFENNIKVFENFSVGDDINSIISSNPSIHEFLKNNSSTDNLVEPDILYNNIGQISYLRYYLNNTDTESTYLNIFIDGEEISEISISKDTNKSSCLTPIANYFK